MTPEQIDKRMAEIEGHTLFQDKDDGTYYVEHIETGRYWSPRTRWEDCGPLIEKYRLCISSDDDTDETYFERGLIWEAGRSLYGCDAKDSDLKTAICLAIIAAQEDKDSE